MARRLVFDPTAGQEFVDQWRRYDWRLLLLGHVHRVDDTASLDQAGAVLAELGYLVHRVDAGGLRTAHELHDALAAAMSFPAHYGRNLDALNDVLSDVAAYEYGSDPATTGTVLLLDGYDRVSDIDPWLAHAVVDIFACQARFAALLGHPMLCVAATMADLGAVGAMMVNSLR